MVPVEPISLSLGVASLAIQILDGIKKGYGYFEEAVGVPDDCASFRLRLRIEMCRLLDWAEIVGLADERKHELFNQKMETDRVMILALLSEVQVLLERMRKLGLDYSELQWDEPVQSTAGAETSTSPARRLSAGETRPSNDGIYVTIDSSLEQYTSSSKLTTNRAKPIPDKVPMESIDLEEYSTLFRPQDKSAEMKRYHRGLNHLIKISQGAKSIAARPKRIRWVLKDRDSFSKALLRLKGLTDYLHETVGDVKLKVLIDQGRDTYMAMLQLTSSVTEMKDLLVAAQFSRSSLQPSGGCSLSRSGTLANKAIDEDASFKSRWETSAETFLERLTRFSIMYAQICGDEDPSHTSKTKLSHNDISSLEYYEAVDRESRILASFRGKPVWIEWKYYKAQPIGTGPEARWGIPEVLEKHVRDLVVLLQADEKPSEFCIPDCLGYFQDEAKNRLGFMYASKDAKDRANRPVSLFEMLRSATPPISVRIVLAESLCRSLLYLHSVGWLHKGLRSASVVFISEGSNAVDVTRPYISSFEYARPDQQNLTTTSPPEDLKWAVYCHPDKQGMDAKPGYRKTYDMYSLGIILLEIAYWKPADEILGFRSAEQDQITATLSETKGVREKLLGDSLDYLKNVRALCGERYHDATRACLEGLTYFKLPTNADENNPVVSALLQQAFLHVVVDKIGSIVL